MSENKLNLVTKTIESISDPGLRKYIFVGRMVTEKVILDDLTLYMSNMMLMAFWGYYIIWREKFDRNVATTTTERRIDDSFRKIYSNGALTHENIAYILTEIQLDASNTKKKSVFSGLIGDNVKNSVFQAVAEIIRIWRIRYRRANKGVSNLVENYLTLLDQLVILKGITLQERDGKLFMQVAVPEGYDLKKYPSEPLDMSLFIRYIQNEETYEEDYYFLYRAERKSVNKDSKIKCTYLSFNGSMSYNDDTEDCLMPLVKFNERSGLPIRDKQDVDIIKSLNVHDFKYMHRLALAVTDALGEYTKRALLEHVLKEGRNYPKSLRTIPYNEINWDVIVTLFMLEEGSSDLLEFVFKDDLNAFYDILSKLPVRFKMDMTYEQLKERFEELNRRERLYQEKVLGISGLQDVLVEWTQKAQISFRAQYIISTIVSEIPPIDDAITINAFYAESLSIKEKKLQTIMKRGNTIETVHVINKTLERIFRMLILFYRGLLAYAEKRQKKLEDLVDKSICNQDRFIVETQKECEDAFFKEVERIINGSYIDGRPPIMRASLGALIGEFRLLCNEMESRRNNVTQYSEAGYLLHSLIGRKAICDVSLFDSILESKPVDFQGLDDYPKNLTEFINSVKHDTNKTYSQIDKITDIYLEYVHELFLFLTFNADYRTEAKKQIQSVFDPVFPYIVRYSEKSENRDMCSISHYIINVDGEYDKTQEIKLLTENEYQINELYYCIPNAESSTKNWWVTPFLISCRRFDSLLLNIEEE